MNIQDTKCNSRIGTQNDKIRSKEEGVRRNSIKLANSHIISYDIYNN